MSLGAGASVGDGGSGGSTGTGAVAPGGAAAGSGSGAGSGAGGSSAGGSTGSGGAGSTQTGQTGGQAGAGNTGLGNGGAGAGSASWRDSLPDELKSDATLGKYSDVTNLAKAHVELQKIIGQKNAGAIRKPAPDASAEEIKAFREALGIPTDPTKYDLGDFKDVKVDPKIVDWAKKVGSEHGIDPAALKAVITDYMKIDAQNQMIAKQTVENKMKTDLDGLKKEWGEAFDQNIKRANFAAEKLGGKTLVDRLVQFGAHNDPVILKAFSEAAKLYGEDRLREGGVGDSRTTPAELDSEIADVQRQMFDMKPSDGRYAGLKARYESLWKQKTGGR